MDGMTVRQLRSLCREKSIQAGGLKHEMIDRILDFEFQESSGPEEEEAPPEEAGDSPADALMALKVVELRAICKKRSLRTSGKKADLVSRILEDDAQLATAESDASADGEDGEGDRWQAREEELYELPLPNLRALCHGRGLGSHGQRFQLIARVLESEFPRIAARRRAERELVEEQEEAHEEEEEADDDLEGSQALETLLASRAKRTPAEQIVRAIEQEDVDLQSLEEMFRVDQPPVGSIITGEVKSLLDYGAFVQIHKSPWCGLLHVSEIADTFIENIEEYLQRGDEVRCVVIPGHGDRLDRVNLSMKRLEELTDDGEPDFGPPETAPIQRSNTVMSQRRDPLLVKLERLQIRIGAIEALMNELGHGPELRGAQEDSRVSLSMPAVPPAETLLGGLDSKPADTQEAFTAKSALTTTLQDLGFDDDDEDDELEDDELEDDE